MGFLIDWLKSLFMSPISKKFLTRVCPKNGPKIPVNVDCTNGYDYQNVVISEFDANCLHLRKDFYPDYDTDYDACVYLSGVCAIHIYRKTDTRTTSHPVTNVSQEVAEMLG